MTSKLTTQAYQGIRDELTEPVAKLRQLGEKLIAEKQLTWWDKNINSNYHRLFDNMYIRGPRTFQFKDPWTDTTLTEAEREYLKYALLVINKNRYGSHNSDESILARKDSDRTKFFNVPLK
jgi:hypothetical protein